MIYISPELWNAFINYFKDLKEDASQSLTRSVGITNVKEIFAHLKIQNEVKSQRHRETDLVCSGSSDGVRLRHDLML